MFNKRDDGIRPAAVPPPAPVADVPLVRSEPPRPAVEREAMSFGKSIVVKGELSGGEDLTIEGLVEGRIELGQHVLTVGASGRIRAEVFARMVIVHGDVQGNITATEKIDIREKGSVEGDLAAPRVAIADGAHFRGSIDMQRASPAAASSGGAEPRPAAAASGGGPTLALR